MRYDTPDSKVLMGLILNTLSNDPHLTDVELIEFTCGVSDLQEYSRHHEHILHCNMCGAQAERLSAQLATWQDPAQIERLEARIGRPAVMRQKAVEPWWSRIADWVSVAPLRAGLGARAAGLDEEVIRFPVHGPIDIAPGLSGIIQRRGQEFRVRITPSIELGASYQDRLVEVVLVESGTDNVLLQRNIPINRFVLLGTDLPIRTEKIAAKLIT